MNARELLNVLTIAERLKDTTRHCYTSGGRHESVAEHSWMMTLMAFLMKNELPEVNMEKVIQMCIIHDLGECFTGDIPVFEKNDQDEEVEKQLLYNWVKSLPQDISNEMLEIYEEMEARETTEAKVYKAIDGMEAIIQHNLSDIRTWMPNEYELQMEYANDRVGFSEYLTQLREEIRNDTIEKINKNKS